MPKIVNIKSQAEHLPKALEIAVKHKMTIYDALFIALGINTEAPLLTSNNEQVEKSKDYGVITILL